MAATVDNRVVSLEFDNNEFEKKIASTLEALEQLERKLNTAGGTDAFSKIDAAAKGTDISSVGQAAEEAGRSFSKLEIMGITALANITNSAVNLGKKLVSNLVAPITSGGLQRALNIEQANFQFEGMNIQKTKATAKSYDEVMQAVLGTAYSYDVAAKAASQLAASNVGVTETIDDQGNKIKYLNADMTKSLMGIAGVASMTGSSFEDISQVFTRVAGQGRVMSNDLNSIAARGLNAAATLADYLGITEAEVRDMVTKGKIDFQTFSDAMAEAYGSHAKDSTKMFTGAMEDVKAALARIGADVYGPLLESGRDALNSMVPLIDVIHEDLNPAIQTSTEFVDKMTQKFVSLMNVMTLIASKTPGAFAVDYPERFTDALDKLGVSTKVQVQDLTLLEKAGLPLDKIAKTFGKSGDELKKMAADGDLGLKTLLTDFQKYSLSIKDDEKATKQFTDALGELAISKLPDDVKEIVGTLKNVLGDTISFGKNIISIGGSALKLIFSALDALSPLAELILHLTSGFAGLLSKTTEAAADFDIFGKAAKGVEVVCSGIEAVISSVVDGFEKLASKVGGVGKLFTTVTDSMAAGMNGVSNLIGAGGFMMIAKTISVFAKNISTIPNLLKSFGGTMEGVGLATEKFQIVLGKVRVALTAWQQNLQAGTLMKLAAAIGAIAIAMKIMSTIPAYKLGIVLGYMTEAIAGLAATMMAATKIMSPKAMMTMGTATTSMIKIAAAMYIMAKSFTVVAQLSWNDLAKGIVGISALTGAILILTKQLAGADKLQKGLTGLILIATSIRILVSSVVALSALSWKELGKGFSGLAALLAGIIAISKWIDKSAGFLAVAAGMVLMASAIKMMAGAIATMSGIENIGQGLLGLAAVMASVIVLSKFINTGSAAGFLATAAGMVLMGTAMNLMAGAIAKFGDMNNLVNGVGAFTVVLAELVIATKLMEGSIAGAAAMMIVALAVGNLAISIALFAALDPMKVVTAIVELAGALLVFGTIAAVLGTAAPLLIAFGAALAVFAGAAAIGGLAMQAVGIGLLKVAVGVTAISTATVSIGKMVGILLSLSGCLVVLGPAALIAAPGLLALSAAMLVLGGAITLGAAGMSLLTGSILTLVPLSKQLPKLAGSMMELGLAIGELGAASLLLIIGAPLLISTAAALATMSAAALVGNLALPVFSKKFEAFAKSIKSSSSARKELSKYAKDINKFANDIRKSSTDITKISKSFDSLGKNIVKSANDGISKDSNTVSKTFNTTMDKVVKGLKAYYSQFKSAGSYVTDGLIAGLNSRLPALSAAAARMGRTAISSAKAALKEHSPSKAAYELGDFFGLGFIGGVENTFSKITSTSKRMGQLALASVSDSLSNIDANMDLSPTITPVLDLSNISSSARQIGNILGDGNTIKLASSIKGTMPRNNADIYSAISKLKDALNAEGLKRPQNVYNINGLTYEEGSAVANAVGELVRVARVEGRS